jgi:ubiquinone/menaquinone biosynthesis C-methylase UbiE
LYEELHRAGGFRAEKEYYRVLATLVKGSKAVDVACGEGYIEQFSPETIGVDFSKVALRKAKLNGAKYLVHAAAEHLPFNEDAFDVALCLGSLEHFIDQQEALSEMVRISRIQILTIHAKLPLPLNFVKVIKDVIFKMEGKLLQPIEKPLSWQDINNLLNIAGATILFRGTWKYLDISGVWSKAPSLIVRMANRFPWHYFVIAYVRAKTR